ncbi:hypothetical protein Moror_5715 [Moniliophthora roreri MCA 2997]|uniref:Uncharacterized protein n=1 Tax=Moniliophthora roreri (strain MCA 2997) TaxID=1381753 RepID=V2Y6N3_MONRO|nr:hypothetical protein Moror_5715 [Moniliophthora roreri MCA 2997]
MSCSIINVPKLFLHDYSCIADAPYYDWDKFSADISGTKSLSTYLQLWLRYGNNTLIIKTQEIVPFEHVWSNAEDSKIAQRAFDLVEIIRPLLSTIDFGSGEKRMNWAHLVRVSDRDYRLVTAKKRSLVPLKTLPWLPLISEDSISCIKWYSIYMMLGRWMNREVTVFAVCDEGPMRLLDATMRGLKLIRHLDLFYHVYGHLSRDGQIVGFVFERVQGRMVDYRDRALLYETFNNLKRHNIVFAPVYYVEDRLSYLTEDVMIIDGKVRLHPRALPYLIPWNASTSNDRDNALPNEKLLQISFKQLASFPEAINPNTPLHLWSHTPLHIALIPSPERLLEVKRAPQNSIMAFLLNVDKNGFYFTPHSQKQGKQRRRHKGQRPTDDSEGPDIPMSRSLYRKLPSVSRPSKCRTSTEPSTMHMSRSATHSRRHANNSFMKLLLANDEYDDDFARFHEDHSETSDRLQELE